MSKNSIPQGVYDVSLASWDGHTHPGLTQLNEKWRLQLLDGTDDEVNVSSFSEDIPDQHLQYSEVLSDSDLMVNGTNGDVVKVRAYHWSVENSDSNANSVHAICAAFDLTSTFDFTFDQQLPDKPVDRGDVATQQLIAKLAAEPSGTPVTFSVISSPISGVTHTFAGSDTCNPPSPVGNICENAVFLNFDVTCVLKFNQMCTEVAVGHIQDFTQIYKIDLLTGIEGDQ